MIADPTGVSSLSSVRELSVARFPKREPVREYGLPGVAMDGARAVEDLNVLFLLGVMPARGVPRTLEERLEEVGARLGGFLRKGDSGRGREGRLGLKLGLEGRTPGPTV